MRTGRKRPSMAGTPKKKKKIGRKILAVLVLVGAGFLVYKTVDFSPAIEKLTHDKVVAVDSTEIKTEVKLVDSNRTSEAEKDSILVSENTLTMGDRLDQFNEFLQARINKFFEVKSFSIRGIDSIIEDSLTADLDTIIGLPILDLDLFGIAASFEKHPRIKDASVRRILPGTLQIKIEERREEALVLAKGKLYGVDSENMILSEPRPGWVLDKPIITGYDGDLIPGQKIEDESVLKAIEWVRQSNLNPGVLGWISEISIHDGEIEKLMGNDGWEVKPGAHDLKRQIATMETFLAEIENRGTQKGSVDLRFPEFLIVKRGS